MRFYPPTSGEILIDGNPIDALNINWVRNNITLVEQRSVLFNDSVLKNIAFGRHDYETVSTEDVQKSIEVAMLHSVLDSLPQGLETCVGPGGNLLSGGQKERVAIARARLRDTQILILDEPTSALDPANRVAVMKAIRKWRSGKTTIIITHDMSQITDEDFVYILENGTIVQSGYKETVEKQPGSEKYFHATTKDDARDGSTRKESGERGYYGLSWEGSARRSMAREPSMSPERYNPREMLAQQHNRSSSWSGTWNSAPRRSGAYSVDDTVLNISYDLSKRGSLLGIPRREASPVRPGSYYSKPMEDLDMVQIDYGYGDDQSARSTYDSFSGPESKRPKLGNDRVSKPQNEDNDNGMASVSHIMGTIVPTLTPKQRVILFLGVASALAHASATPIFSYCLSQLFSTFYAGTNSARLTMTWSLAVLGVSFGDGLASFFMHYFLEFCGEAWMDSHRKKAFERVLDQPRAWFEKDGNSSFRLTAYLDQNGDDMRNLLGRFAGFIIVAASITVMAIIWSLIVCWKLTLVALACGPLIYAITRGFEGVNGLWEHRCSEANAVATDIFTETFAEIRTVRTLTLEAYFHNKQADAISRCLAIGLKRAGYTGLLFGLLEPTVMFGSGKSRHVLKGMNSVCRLTWLALIFYYGAVLVASEFTVNDVMMVFSLLLFSIGYAAQILSWSKHKTLTYA